MADLSLRVEGADAFFALAQRLKEAGDKDLQRELYRGLDRAVKPATEAIRASAISTLPSRGGYNVTIAADLRIRVQRRTGARSVGIKLIGTGRTNSGKARELVKLDKGSLRKPLFGMRRHWYPQKVTPGFWTGPARGTEPQVRTRLLIAMKNVADKIEG